MIVDIRLVISDVPGLGFRVAELETPGLQPLKLGMLATGIVRQFPLLAEAWVELMRDMATEAITAAGFEQVGEPKRRDFAVDRN